MELTDLTAAQFLDAIVEASAEGGWKAQIMSSQSSALGRRKPLTGPGVEAAREIGSNILSPRDPCSKQVLGELVLTKIATQYARDLVSRILEELYLPIHRMLCRKAAGASLTQNALVGAQVAGLTQLIVEHFHVNAAVALGAATLLVTAIVRGVQGTFCAMSKTELLSRLAAMRV